MSHKKHSKTYGEQTQHEAKTPQAREQKREQFSKPARSSNNLKLIIVMAALAAVVAYFVVGALNQNSTTATVASATTVQPPPGASEIRIPLGEVSSGQAKFFETALSNNKTARFFVIKTSDGVYRAALDACQVCNYARKGYYQDGDQMVCKKCGRHFAVTDVNDGTSGCHPIGLTRQSDGQNLFIKMSELERGSQYF